MVAAFVSTFNVENENSDISIFPSAEFIIEGNLDTTWTDSNTPRPSKTKGLASAACWQFQVFNAELSLRTARENTEQNCNIRNHQLNFMNMIISLHAFSFSFFCFLERNVQEKCRAGQEIKGGAKE